MAVEYKVNANSVRYVTLPPGGRITWRILMPESGDFPKWMNRMLDSERFCAEHRLECVKHPTSWGYLLSITKPAKQSGWLRKLVAHLNEEGEVDSVEQPPELFNAAAYSDEEPTFDRIVVPD